MLHPLPIPCTIIIFPAWMRRCYCGNGVKHRKECEDSTSNNNCHTRDQPPYSWCVVVAQAAVSQLVWDWKMIFCVRKIYKNVFIKFVGSAVTTSVTPAHPPRHHQRPTGVTLRIVIVPPSINSFGHRGWKTKNGDQQIISSSMMTMMRMCKKCGTRKINCKFRNK